MPNDTIKTAAEPSVKYKTRGKQNSLKRNSRRNISNSSQDVELSQLSMSDRRRISTIFTLLETAISKGDHYEAADLAKELAGLKIPCSVAKTEPTTPDKALRRHSSVNSDDNYSLYKSNKNSAYSHDNTDDYEIVEFQHESPVISRQKSINFSKRRQIKSEIIPNDLYSTSNAHRTIFNVQLFVEDRTSHQGPINVSVDSQMTVGQLRTKVHENFGFPPEVQRWILGRRLADSDEETLSYYHITTEGCPIFLYLVAPDQGKVFSIDKPVHKSNLEIFSNTSNDIRNIRSTEKHEHFMNSNRSLRFEPEEMNDLESNVESSDDEKTKDTLFHTRSNRINDPMETDTYSGMKLANGTSRLKNIKEEPKSTNTNDSKSVRPPSLPKRVDSNESMNISIHRCSKFIDAVKQNDIKKSNSIDSTGERKPVAQVNQNNRTFKDAFQNPAGNSVKLKNKHEHNPIDSIEEKKPIAQAVQYKSIDNIKERKPIAKTNQNNGSFEDALQNLAKQIPQANQNSTGNNALQNPAKSIAQASQNSTGNDALQNPAKEIAQASQNNFPGNGALQNPAKEIAQASQNPTGNEALQNPAKSIAQASQNNSPGNGAFQNPAKSIAQTSQKNSTSYGASQAPAAESNDDTWQCPQCTLMNPAARPGCEACSAAKPQLDKQVLPLESLDKMDLVLCTDEFECSICYRTVEIGEGIVLRECLHTFCRECLRDTARYSDNAAVTCPYRDDQYSCKANLQDREVKALVNAKDFDAHLNKSVKQAAGAMENVFHCKTPDCKGFCVFEDNVNVFLCNVCFKQNCLTCQAQHTEVSCKQYQEMLASQEDLDSLKTKKFFEDMIARGDGMPCPACSVMLVRKWGCDWMKCPMCRTEICWVTRKPRWGPRGPGDTTGGCQCGLYGRKCHPKCSYCH